MKEDKTFFPLTVVIFRFTFTTFSSWLVFSSLLFGIILVYNLVVELYVLVLPGEEPL